MTYDQKKTPFDAWIGVWAHLDKEYGMFRTPDGYNEHILNQGNSPYMTVVKL